MKTMNNPDPVSLQQEARGFRNRFQSVLVSTADGKGTPDLGSAPFVLDDGERICVFISELAMHTRNLLDDSRACLAFMEAEEDCRNPFARKRLILHCRAERLASGKRERLLDRMEERFGSTLGLLRSLGDFHLFAFDIETGSYVRGFGQAWELSGNSLEIRGLRKN